MFGLGSFVLFRLKKIDQYGFISKMVLSSICEPTPHYMSAHLEKLIDIVLLHDEPKSVDNFLDGRPCERATTEAESYTWLILRSLLGLNARCSLCNRKFYRN